MIVSFNLASKIQLQNYQFNMQVYEGGAKLKCDAPPDGGCLIIASLNFFIQYYITSTFMTKFCFMSIFAQLGCFGDEIDWSIGEKS